MMEFCEACVVATTDESAGPTSMFSGIGTTLYPLPWNQGVCESCGSVVMIKFYTLVYVPIFALGKYRVIWLKRKLLRNQTYLSRRARSPGPSNPLFVRWFWRRSGELHVRSGRWTLVPAFVAATAWAIGEVAQGQPVRHALMYYPISLVYAWAGVATVRILASRAPRRRELTNGTEPNYWVRLMDVIWANRYGHVRLPLPFVNVVTDIGFMFIVGIVTTWRMFTSRPTDWESRIAAAILLVPLFGLVALFMYR